MASSISGMSLSAPPRVLARAPDAPKVRPVWSPQLNRPWKMSKGFGSGALRLRPAAAAPDKISEKVEKSIKNAEETCSDDPASGECVAAWDEVEELSAAASHARDRKKEFDPLEEYCKDNPETKECRTYED
ncbi:calvin cycle protein CP12-1, chloroplastic [Malania oleifera]|uniref:calvin cycle protein CP12-1, chloroplastic n=1 Tax=Malania oleifera TaxID=397392 RepID=UPI0025AE71EF|nr:calvin cycle protein CP12-1, chloroplastic [Malania oleifera]